MTGLVQVYRAPTPADSSRLSVQAVRPSTRRTTVKAERIKVDADYQGVRVRFVGMLGKAKIATQLDVGFGDVVVPGPEEIDYPHGTLNRRMKDFYHIWLLSRQFE